MKAAHVGSLASLLALASLPLVHCSSNKDTTVTFDAGGSNPAFSYQPQGCSYAVSPPASRGFTDFALDDATAPSDAAGATPARVRVGVGGDTKKGQAGYADPTTTAAFLWETAARTTNAKVRLGTAPGTLGDVHAGFVFTNPPPTSALGSGEPPTYMHETHVCGLKPGTTYYYQVGGGAAGSEVWSATQSFATVPASGTITVGLFGDSRDQVTTWQMVHARMRDAAVSLMLLSGDMVVVATEESLFTQWLDAIWKDPNDASKFLTLGQIPMVPIGGNHENESSQFFGSFTIPGTGDYAEQYASFDVGNTHFVLFDDQQVAENPGSDAATALLAWLDADLAAADADRGAHPFVVVVSHRGLFGTSNHAADTDVIAARGALAPLFDAHHVDVVMNGHDHEFERSQPLKAGSPATGAPVVGRGTVYYVNGGAGADGYAPQSHDAPYRNGAAVGFGKYSTMGYIGAYTIATLAGSKLTLTSYGMKSSSTTVAGDDVIDTLTLGQ